MAKTITTISFELWEVRRFADGIISVDQVQATSKESIKQIAPTQENSVINQVSSEIEVYREEDHVNNLSPAMSEVWEELRANLEDWPDSSFYVRQQYVGLKCGNKTACFIQFQKNALRIDLSRGETTETGERSSNFFYLDDYKNLAEEKSWVYKSGRTGHKYSIPLKRLEDVSYVLQLIEQKCKSIYPPRTAPQKKPQIPLSVIMLCSQMKNGKFHALMETGLWEKNIYHSLCCLCL